MNPLLAIIIILACFGIVGRIDYEAAIATDMSFRPAQTAEARQ
jgi:hypothetical protein